MIPVSNTFENRFGGSGGDGGASLTQKTCALEGEYVSRAVETIIKIRQASYS